MWTTRHNHDVKEYDFDLINIALHDGFITHVLSAHINLRPVR